MPQSWAGRGPARPEEVEAGEAATITPGANRGRSARAASGAGPVLTGRGGRVAERRDLTFAGLTPIARGRLLDHRLQLGEVDRLGQVGRRTRPRGSARCRPPSRSRSGRSPTRPCRPFNSRIRSRPLPSGRPMSLTTRSNSGAWRPPGPSATLLGRRHGVPGAPQQPRHDRASPRRPRPAGCWSGRCSAGRGRDRLAGAAGPSAGDGRQVDAEGRPPALRPRWRRSRSRRGPRRSPG